MVLMLNDNASNGIKACEEMKTSHFVFIVHLIHIVVRQDVFQWEVWWKPTYKLDILKLVETENKSFSDEITSNL